MAKRVGSWAFSCEVSNFDWINHVVLSAGFRKQPRPNKNKNHDFYQSNFSVNVVLAVRALELNIEKW